MARGTTLEKLLNLYRAECRLSLNVAHNTQHRDQQVSHIQRTQEWLWEDFDWPLLRVERKFDLADGQYLYDVPSDMHIDRIQKVEVFENASYQPLCPGIDAVHYTVYNSELDERQWPPQRWKISEDEQIEIWPIPNTDAVPATLEGTVKLTGIRTLSALVDDSDRADLDDRLIILFCAAEVLASTGAKDATMKLNMANSRYSKLRGNQSKRVKYSMFGSGSGNNSPLRVPIAVYNGS